MRQFDDEVPLAGPIVGILYIALVTVGFSVVGLALAVVIAWVF